MNDLDLRLRDATANIGPEYILLPIQGQPAAYRERVYCYELYHQLRRDWPANTPFKLNGEVDKAGHQLLRLSNADRCKPDFLIHTPGSMDGNFVVIEVKPCTASNKAIRKDLSTLALFVNEVKYERAIYLIYGAQADLMAARARTQFANVPGSDAIQIWVHRHAFGAAERWER